MKKILFLILCISMVGMYSCQDSISDLNVDKKRPTSVSAEALFVNATVELFDWMASTNVNENNLRLWAQSWAQTQYTDESNYELIERNVNGRTWNTMYATVIQDARSAKPIIDADEFLSDAEKTNQKAMCEVLEILAFHYLVDLFGDVPYTEALNGEIVAPAYDNDSEIYSDLADRLDVAIGQLNGASGMNGDLIYGGNADNWRKAANSLKLRLAIRMADSNDAKAKTMVEEAVADGVITASSEDFKIHYQSATPNTNPLWEDLVQSGRTDFIACSVLTDRMNAMEDPRRSSYFMDLGQIIDTVITGTDTTITTYTGAIGGGAGASNSYAGSSKPGTMQRNPTMPHSLIDFTEVSFLLADASERGYSVGGSASEHYTNGIASSFIEWGAFNLNDYLQRSDVDYDTAPGTWKEKIALQKWIAMYNRGFEAWSTYRLYDAPTMSVAAEAGTLPPTRYTYPVTEYSLNGPSVEAASASIGGDDSFTKVFWDIN